MARLHVTQIPERVQVVIDKAAKLLGATEHHDPSQSAAATIFLMTGAKMFESLPTVRLQRKFLAAMYVKSKRRRKGRPKKVG